MIYWLAMLAFFFVVENFGAAALVIWLLQRRHDYPKWLGVAVCVWAAVMSSMFLLELFEPPSWKVIMREYFYLPMAMEMVWNVLFLQAVVPTLIIVVFLIRRYSPKPVTEPLTPSGISRRNFLYLLGVGAVPAVSFGMGVHGALSRDDLQMREFDIAIPGLPPGLEGFRIAHVSDLHSGLFVGPRRLRIMSDATNDLKADLITITGDVINREMEEFPAALEAIQRLESRCGLYLCEGNHDVIPGDGIMVRACAENRLPMLYNSSVALPFDGGRLILGGLPWATHGEGVPPQAVTNLFPPRAPGDVRVLLAHHPHVFDIAQSADLLLSGHTHGGQIMFGKIGLGNLRFKYCSGRFDREGTTMIVSNGCGDWFPCRIGAPAEIGLIRLVRAAG
jgi:uncharacterized protein